MKRPGSGALEAARFEENTGADSLLIVANAVVATEKWSSALEEEHGRGPLGSRACAARPTLLARECCGVWWKGEVCNYKKREFHKSVSRWSRYIKFGAQPRGSCTVDAG